MFENYRMNMLNKRASSPESRPAKVLKSLDIHDGDVIGDIGTGGGYFTFEFSKKVGENGKVYAIDVNQKSLDFIYNKSKKEGITNIEPVLADEAGFLLPKKVDLLFLRNVFHHLPEPTEYFKNLRQFLKDDGKIAIMDYKKKAYKHEVFVHSKSSISMPRKQSFRGLQKFLEFLRGFSFVGMFGHYTPEETIIGIMEKAGFSVFEKFDFLDNQSFIIFK